MKPVLIFGAGQIAQVFAAYLEGNGYEVAAYVVDPEYADAVAPGAPVLTTLALNDLPPDRYCFTVGMSFKGLNSHRAAKFAEMKARGYEPLTFVDRRAKIIGNPVIGEGSFIMDGNCIQPNVGIGANVIAWSGNHFGHDTKIGNHVFIASHAVISGAVEIGDRCFVGVNATIRDGVKIGAGCIIGAGALILKDCEPDGIYAVKGTLRRDVPASQLGRI